MGSIPAKRQWPSQECPAPCSCLSNRTTDRDTQAYTMLKDLELPPSGRKKRTPTTHLKLYIILSINIKKQVGWSMLLFHMLYLIPLGKPEIKDKKIRRLQDSKHCWPISKKEHQLLMCYAVETKRAMFRNSFFPRDNHTNYYRLEVEPRRQHSLHRDRWKI